MKTLKNVNTFIAAGKVTITADVADTAPDEYRLPIQQVTVGYLHPDNIHHHRHIQISGEGLFVKGNGNAFVINHDDLVAIAAQVEPKTSYSPLFKSTPTPQKIEVEFSSELQPTLQWKWSDGSNPQGQWADIEGATGSALENKPELKGKWVSCVAISEAGAASTPPIQL